MAIPPVDSPEFSYETSYVCWKEIVTNAKESDIQDIVEHFLSHNGNNQSSYSATYRKYDSTYNGPWVIVYYEYFKNAHNVSNEYKIWFEKNRINFFCHMAYPNYNPTTFTDYLECWIGLFQWRIILDNISEAEIQDTIAQFKKMSTLSTSNSNFDYFDAEYNIYNPTNAVALTPKCNTP